MATACSPSNCKQEKAIENAPVLGKQQIKGRSLKHWTLFACRGESLVRQCVQEKEQSDVRERTAESGTEEEKEGSNLTSDWVIENTREERTFWYARKGGRKKVRKKKRSSRYLRRL